LSYPIFIIAQKEKVYLLKEKNRPSKKLSKVVSSGLNINN